METLPINFNGLDTAIHGPIRLGVLTALSIHGPLDFTTLKRRLEVADGPLGQHLGKLQETGYIVARKRFIARRPNTSYQLTATGRRAFAQYLESMRRLLNRLEDVG